MSGHETDRAWVVQLRKGLVELSELSKGSTENIAMGWEGVIEKIITLRSNNNIKIINGEVSRVLWRQLEEFANYRAEKEKLQKSDLTATEFWTKETSRLLNTFSQVTGKVLASGFSEEGFESLAERIKEGFKKILAVIIDSLSNMLYAGSIASIIEGIFNPVKAVADMGKIIAGKLSLEILKGMVMSMATGGMVTKPTLVLAGDAGAELYAPKKDFLSVARELIIQERRNIPAIQNHKQQPITLQMKPVRLVQKGRDMVGVIELEKRIDKSTRI